MTSWRTAAKRALGTPMGLLRFARHAPRRWVLTFHDVGDHPWSTPPARFLEILEVLRRHARLLSLPELLTSKDDDSLGVSLTFDDGYLSVAERAVPALRSLSVPVTVFLPTDLLSEEDALPAQDRGLYAGLPLMGWRSVRRLAAAPLVRFESHGSAHASLPTLSPEARLDDLRRSLDAITMETGKPPRYLAYPYGEADRACADAARHLGFEAAFTTRHGGLRLGGDPFLLARIDVRGDYSPSDVLAILNGDWDFLSGWQALRRRP